MLISIWRYGHFTLALVSSIFILILSLTGIILALEPVSNSLNENPKVSGDFDISLAQLHQNLIKTYDEILEIKLDSKDQLIVSVIENGSEKNFYINPLSAEKTGDLEKKSELFTFATNLHRSLFFKTSGRIIVGVFSFLLFLISLTGLVLFLKRQKGIANYFQKIVKDNWATYTHIQLSRFFLFPILIITISGLYLSLLRFSIIPNLKQEASVPKIEMASHPEIEIGDFTFFQTLKLSEIQSVIYPFFRDPNEFFQVSLKDQELLINQYTGEIISEQEQPWLNSFSVLMFDLHTGRTNILWALILGVSCISILVFMYSGFAVSLKRRSGKIKNSYGKHESDIFIGVASENGSTLLFAKSFQLALSAIGKKAHVFHLNQIEAFPNMKQLVIFAASYGDGEAPSNSTTFLQRLENIDFKKPFYFSVLGFGSIAYPKFCGFAKAIHNALLHKPKALLQSDYSTVNNQSFESFNRWCENWTLLSNLPKLKPLQLEVKISNKGLHLFKVISKKSLDENLILGFTSQQKQKARSGDLIAIRTKKEDKPRFYSLGVLPNNELLIAVKKHDQGLCSNYLARLNSNDEFLAQLIKNKKFHFPKTKKEVLMICTGTGITPFLGMLQNPRNKNTSHLYWGLKFEKSIELYQEQIEAIQAQEKLQTLALAYSQNGAKKEYVQDLLERDEQKTMSILEKGGVIMICGSVAMQSGVLALLQSQCLAQHKKPLSYYENLGQLKMDCY